MSDQVDWQAKLPFLKWRTRPDGRLSVPISKTPDGHWGYATTDRGVVKFDDPSVAEYTKSSIDEAARPIRLKWAGLEDHILDLNEPKPFPSSFYRNNPQTMAWINGLAPDYRPTVADLWVYGIYQERLRRLREQSIVGSQVRHSDALVCEMTTQSDNNAWSRLMTLAEAGRLLGGPKSDDGARKHLAILIDGKREEVVHSSKGGKKHRFRLDWVHGIEPTKIDLFR